MNSGHQDLFIDERIELVVGRLPEIKAKYLVPQELLIRRSRGFRERLHGSNIRLIELLNTPPTTARQFFIWIQSPQPRIEEEASFEDIASLGVFACQYGIPALSNQVTDRIRGRLATDEWHLQPNIVDMVYDSTSSDDHIRQIVREALGNVPISTVTEDPELRISWEKTFLKHAALGWDFVLSRGMIWKPEEFLSGVCRFHDHDDVLDQTTASALCDGCPYAEVDCYPTFPGPAVVPNTDKAGHDAVPVTNGDASHTNGDINTMPTIYDPHNVQHGKRPDGVQATSAPDHQAQDGTLVGNGLMLNPLRDDLNIRTTSNESPQAPYPSPRGTTSVLNGTNNGSTTTTAEVIAPRSEKSNGNTITTTGTTLAARSSKSTGIARTNGHATTAASNTTFSAAVALTALEETTEETTLTSDDQLDDTTTTNNNNNNNNNTIPSVQTLLSKGQQQGLGKNNVDGPGFGNGEVAAGEKADDEASPPLGKAKGGGSKKKKKQRGQSFSVGGL